MPVHPHSIPRVQLERRPSEQAASVNAENCKKEKAKHANSHDDHQTAQTADKSRLLIPYPPVTDKIRHQ